MVSPKLWKTEALLRLVLSIFVCVFAGSLMVGAVYYAGPRSGRVLFGAVFGGALVFLGLTLLLLRRSWRAGALPGRLALLLGCFYAGLLLGAWASKLAGDVKPSMGQVVISTLSFQGLALVLIGRFLHDHGAGWREAFGFRNRWGFAVFIGIVAAGLFLPMSYALQWVSAELIVHLHFKPEQQQVVQTLQMNSSWTGRLVAGLITIVLVPPAEETLFRGVLYPWIKQAGFPRLALWGTSVLFGLMHFNLLTFVPLTVLALCLAILYEFTDNLLAPIAAHAVFNALNFLRLLNS